MGWYVALPVQPRAIVHSTAATFAKTLFVSVSSLLSAPPRFLLGLLIGAMVACRTIVSEVCGNEHDTVGMGVVTGELWPDRIVGVFPARSASTHGDNCAESLRAHWITLAW